MCKKVPQVALPDKWTPDLISNLAFTPLKLDWQPCSGTNRDWDALVEIGEVAKASATFGVEYKSDASPQSLAFSAMQIEARAQRDQILPLLVVPYLSEKRLLELEQQKISAIDLCGNGIVRAPGQFYVFRTGYPNRFTSSRPLKNVYRGVSYLAVRTFLLKPRYAEIRELQQQVAGSDAPLLLKGIPTGAPSLPNFPNLLTERSPLTPICTNSILMSTITKRCPPMSSIKRKLIRSHPTLQHNNTKVTGTASGMPDAVALIPRPQPQNPPSAQAPNTTPRPLTKDQELRQHIKNLEAIIAPAMPPAPSTADLTAVSNIAEEEVTWLLQGWIPAGKVSVIIGEPGLGKSLRTLDIAARLTTGRDMPINTRNNRPPGTVLLFSAEDNVSDTIRPRLAAAGADLSRIHLFPTGGQRQFNDCRTLIRLIKDLSASLVIVDPLSAYLGDRHLSSDHQIRDLFASMAIIARHTGATFLVVHHPNKGRSGSAAMRSSGSLAIAATARSVMLVAKDPEDPTSRILALVKGNLGAAPISQRFTFIQEPGASQPRIHWAGATATYTADKLLHGPDRNERAQLSVERFLREALAKGPMPSRELEEQALAQGFTKSVFTRAKAAITHSTRTGGIGPNGTWQTSLK